MPVYFDYALKVSLCLAIVFLFYFLMLKRMTYYTWNRYFLLLFSMLSFVAPFINVSVFVRTKQIDRIPLVNQISFIPDNKIPLNFINSYQAINFSQLFFAVYILVVLMLFVRLLIQLLSIIKIRSKATLTVANDTIIYHLSEPVLPFSFFDSIFINKNSYSENELHKIIGHERVHVQQKHTVDVLISEMIFIINWYNPFAWLLKNAVRENLEFIADDVVIKKGVDRKNYQYLLLKVTGDIPSAIANNLKFSSLKNRLLMMNKTKTGELHLLKFTLLVPLVVFLLLAFRNKQDTNVNIAKSQSATTKTYTLSSLTYSISDKKVEAVVKKEQAASLLKTGEALNLELVYNERTRIKSLLEKNGFNEIGNHAITFMIDTTLGNNSFSVQVNINLTKGDLNKSEERQGRQDNKMNAEDNTSQSSVEQTSRAMETGKSNSRRQVENGLDNRQLSVNGVSSVK